jgi:hypothetical protein
MKKAEQICRHEKPGRYKKELKRQVKRARRRAERRDPENAPKRVRDLIQGYST